MVHANVNWPLMTFFERQSTACLATWAHVPSISTKEQARCRVAYGRTHIILRFGDLVCAVTFKKLTCRHVIFMQIRYSKAVEPASETRSFQPWPSLCTAPALKIPSLHLPREH
uniref:Uncharacterized protein n=1 Tax=Ixodes ricinus TaxID=34613 RepID=A0A6B0UK96_IXORI